ncbi:MAG: hypothetical protein WCF67_18040 [Chitinophagaceae bacterium]
MRLAAILSLVIMLSAFQCHRTCGPEDGSTTLTGKWKFTEFYMSPGDGSVNWQGAPAGQTYIEFKPDGSFASDLPMLSNYTRYEIIDASSVKLLGAPSPNQFLLGYTISGSRLEIIPPCFEGCAYRFKRQ